MDTCICYGAFGVRAARNRHTCGVFMRRGVEPCRCGAYTPTCVDQTVGNNGLVPAQLLDGKSTAAGIRKQLSERVLDLSRRFRAPKLATVLVGDDPGSHAYVSAKHRDCQEIGVSSVRFDLPSSSTQADVEAILSQLNADPTVDGYIVQLPLPSHVDSMRALEHMDPTKDVDGLHPMNLGRLVLGIDGPLPCTPRGIIVLLDAYGVKTDGAHVVVVGRGVTVGRPLGLLLTRRSVNSTVTLCHTGTKNIEQFTQQADIVVAAAGVPHMITATSIRPGAVVVDVGITRTEDGLVGDVAADVVEVASWLAPMPGGSGPMTRAMLLTNVVENAERKS